MLSSMRCSVFRTASDQTGLEYDFSSPTIASTSKIENNVVKNDLASENINKSKSILGASPKQDKKEVKNPRAKKANFQKPKQKK